MSPNPHQNQDPRPSASSALNRRIARFYDASSGLWESVWGEHMHHGHYGPDGNLRKDRKQAQVDMVEELLRFAAPGEAHDVLDMGCGIGGSATYLARKLGARVTGLTLSPVQARRAAERARGLLGRNGSSSMAGASVDAAESRTARPATIADALDSGPSKPAGDPADTVAPDRTKGTAQFLVADALASGLPDASFDLVWSCESAEHMPDKPALFGECVRLLRPGGSLAMATWCRRPTRAPAPPLGARESRLLERLYAVYCLPPFVSPEALEEAAREAGLVELRREDWSASVSPFWDEVIRSALTPSSVLGLLKAGPQVLRAAFAAQLMRRGLQDGTIRFVVLRGRRAG